MGRAAEHAGAKSTEVGIHMTAQGGLQCWWERIRLLLLLLLFSRSVVSDSLWPRGLQHARLPCPSQSPRACSNPRPSSQWCHPAISSSVVPFSCPQSFPASGSFPVSHLFTSGGPHQVAPIRWSFSFSIGSGLISFSIDWFNLIAAQRTLKCLLQHHYS